MIGEELKEVYGEVNIDINTGEISDEPTGPTKAVADDNQGNT